MMQATEEKEIRRSMEAQGLMGYNEKIVEEYRNSSNEVHIVSKSFFAIILSFTKFLHSSRCTRLIIFKFSILMLRFRKR